MVRRRQFEAYLDKVFAFSDLVAQLSDRRSHPRHPCRKVFEALFLGAVLQCPSLHQLEQECRDGVLRQRIGPVSRQGRRAPALPRHSFFPGLRNRCSCLTGT
jgi:hypothetical protein